MFEKILHTHFERYPTMEIADVYKLIHQSVMGNAHFFQDPKLAKEALLNEIAEMGDGPSEPLLDPISLVGDILRVHLRPYMAKTNDIQPLLDACLRSAEASAPRTDLLESFWMCAIQTQLWEVSEMDKFFAKMRDQGYPSVHHSEEFKRKFKPAYRVLKREYFNNTMYLE